MPWRNEPFAGHPTFIASCRVGARAVPLSLFYLALLVSLSSAPAKMKFGSSHSGGGLSFGLSHLLAEKMGAGKLVGSSLISSSLSSLTRSSFLITRCPAGTLAQLTVEGICNW